MSRPRVVVAEDETLIRLDVEGVLESNGFDVCGLARDGREAVELALELRPDIVLLDINMPHLDGIEAARRILAEYPVPVVMLTAYGYGEIISRAADAGVVAFVVKPFEETTLIDALRQASVKKSDPTGLSCLDRATKHRMHED